MSGIVTSVQIWEHLEGDSCAQQADEQSDADDASVASSSIWWLWSFIGYDLKSKIVVYSSETHKIYKKINLDKKDFRILIYKYSSSIYSSNCDSWV